MPDRRIIAYLVAGAVFALDRLTKWAVQARLSFFDTYKVIPGFFDIVRSENRGVAFGILDASNAGWRTPLLIAASVAAVAMIGAMVWKTERLSRASLWGFGLILGGAAGNLFDRAISGRVTDFLLLYLGSYQWPTFNIADSAIDIGAAVLIIDLIRSKRQAAHVS
jgi:signal peptidase II